MSDTAAVEKWQVEVGGEMYEGSFEELPQWIDEGALLPQDKVRRGNLRWIEAQKVPGLKVFFDAKERGEPLPISIQANTASKDVENSLLPPENILQSIDQTGELENSVSELPTQQNSDFAKSVHAKSTGESPVNLKTDFSTLKNSPSPDAVCSLHADTEAEYLCRTCGNCFCKACPNSYGGSVKICPFCGAMCQSLKIFREKEIKNHQLQSAASESFGAADLMRALSHPFKYKSSLFFGALMFAFFTIGQSAASLGGFVMLGAALFCVLGANMLTFGVLANTIEKFSGGNTEANFMPDFDDFSIWDDVVHPFFLSIGAYLVSFVPFILVCVIGFYLIFSSMTAQANAVQNEIAKVPGSPAFDRQKAIEQSETVKKLTENLHVQNEKKLTRQIEITAEDSVNQMSEEEADFEQIEQMIEESRKSQLESVAGKSPETERQEFEQMIRGFLGLAAPLVVVGFFAFLWGMFYFPAACAVAGYTRSFFATINPLVGLDTIRRLGFDYVKILLMGFLIVVATGVAGMFLSVIFSPFDLPQMGNLPAKALGSFFTFYFSIVFSALLGYALYKNSAKLDLPRG